jgi:heme-degrading monooxygenase HmoA
MSVLLVELQVRDGEEEGVEETFRSTFRPAISSQPGFTSVRLLRPVEPGKWVLEIEFVDEPSRLTWVASDLHQEVWPQIEAHTDHFTPLLFEATS